MELERIYEHLLNVKNDVPVSIEDIEIMECETLESSGNYCDVEL
jgi:hypothetical protein